MHFAVSALELHHALTTVYILLRYLCRDLTER
jgi:hypothetical protein